MFIAHPIRKHFQRQSHVCRKERKLIKQKHILITKVRKKAELSTACQRPYIAVVLTSRRAVEPNRPDTSGYFSSHRQASFPPSYIRRWANWAIISIGEVWQKSSDLVRFNWGSCDACDWTAASATKPRHATPCHAVRPTAINSTHRLTENEWTIARNVDTRETFFLNTWINKQFCNCLCL